MSDAKHLSIETLIKSPWRLVGISDFDVLDSNAKIREYAEAIVEYAQRHGIKITVMEWNQSSETGRLSGLTLQASGMTGSIKYVPPSEQSKRAGIKVELPLARTSTSLQNFDQYCTGLVDLVSKFK